MSDFRGNVLINNEVSDPTGEYVCDYLLSQTKETTFHDFKMTIDLTKNSHDFLKIIKDVYAFSNYGGGWLVLGVKQNDYFNPKIKGKFVKVGLADDFELEDASLQEKINSYLDEPITIQYTEFFRIINKTQRKFALIYFLPSPKIMIPKNDIKYYIKGHEKTVVLKNTIYTRRGTQSVPASNYEIKLIKKRLTKEEYRLSILSGEPEEIHEVLYSNLFEVKNIPAKVYIGIAKHKSFAELIKTLRLVHPEQKYFQLKYRQYEDKIVTFANLTNPMDVHSEIVQRDKILQESVVNWLEDPDKKKIIISLLNKEFTAKAERQGLCYDNKTKKFYYTMPSYENERKEEWATRYRGVQKKQVAKKMWSDKLKRFVYSHGSIRARVIMIDEKFYLMLNPTMMITNDGSTPMIGMKTGTIITAQTYRVYNKQQLNNILFWINKLGDGNNVLVIKDFVISNKSVQTSMEVGITWDIPPADFNQYIEEFDAEMDDEGELEEEIFGS